MPKVRGGQSGFCGGLVVGLRESLSRFRGLIRCATFLSVILNELYGFLLCGSEKLTDVDMCNDFIRIVLEIFYNK